MAMPSWLPSCEINAGDACNPLRTHRYCCGACDASVCAITSMAGPMLTMNVTFREGRPRCSPGAKPSKR
jgi:hypothetical protein